MALAERIIQVNGQLQKIKFTNLKTSEIEYLETILENGKYSYLSTSKLGKLRIESANDKVGLIKITNLDTKEVKYLKPNKSSVTENTIAQGSLASTSTSWYLWSCIRSSYAKEWSTISVCAGIAAAICGLGWVTTGLIGYATYILGNNCPDIWFLQYQYDDLNDSSHHMRNTYLYGYPDYTNLLDYESVEYYGGIF